MVSYYNPLTAMYPKSHCANLYSGASPWYPSNYQPSNAQLFAASAAAASSEGNAQPPMYYPPHIFQSSSPDWHESFSTPPSVNCGPSSAASSGYPHHLLPHNHHNPSQDGASEHLNDGLHSSIPSPPITVSGSEMSSPGCARGGGGGGGGSAGTSATAHIGLHGMGNASPHQMSMRPGPVKSPYEWIKRTSYQNQTNPGKTRTKDKYRVVYTDYQRLELEKEYHTSRYITIRRKTELAQSLSLSERQVKIWFQNRRAKERKQTKKRDDIPLGALSQHILDIKPKQESDLHLQHPALHQMSAMMHNSYPHHVAVAAGLRLGPPLPPASVLSGTSTPNPQSSHPPSTSSASTSAQHPSVHSI